MEAQPAFAGRQAPISVELDRSFYYGADWHLMFINPGLKPGAIHVEPLQDYYRVGFALNALNLLLTCGIISADCGLYIGQAGLRFKFLRTSGIEAFVHGYWCYD